MVSRLEDTYKSYINRKQEIQAETDKKKAVKKAIRIIIPIVVVLTLALVAFAKLRSKRLLRDRQAEAEKMMDRHKEELEHLQNQSEKEMEQMQNRHRHELEQERKNHDRERKSLLLQLKKREDETKSLMEDLGRHRMEAEQKKKTFSNEEVCRAIVDSVCDLSLSARSRYGDYYRLALDEATGVSLGEAVARNFPEFKSQMSVLFPKINAKDLQMCYLYLLDLNNQQIAVLQQRNNSTLYRHVEKLQNSIKSDIPLSDFVRKLAYGCDQKR